MPIPDPRDEIRSGRLRGDALLARLRSLAPEDREAWVDQALGLPPAPPDEPLPRGAVPYLPSGVDAIATAVVEAPITERDRFVDLGSGLGRVAMLVHLLSGAPALGIEIQATLVAAARARCADLGLSEVTFVLGDAAEADLDGSVFYLYAPFNGETRTRVLRRLEALGQRRPLVVCALGFELRDEPWLVPKPCTSVELALYASR